MMKRLIVSMVFVILFPVCLDETPVRDVLVKMEPFRDALSLSPPLMGTEPIENKTVVPLMSSFFAHPDINSPIPADILKKPLMWQFPVPSPAPFAYMSPS